MKGLYVAIPTVNKISSGLLFRLSNDFFFPFPSRALSNKTYLYRDDAHVQRFWLQTQSTLLHSDSLMHCGMLDSPINTAK